MCLSLKWYYGDEKRRVGVACAYPAPQIYFALIERKNDMVFCIKITTKRRHSDVSMEAHIEDCFSFWRAAML